MSLVGGPNILSSMAGVMENNLGVGVGTGGSSTGANSTPSLSPDLPAASSSSDSCPSPMSHNSPPENNMMSFGNGASNNVLNNNQLAQSPQRSHVDKHQSRSHSPTNSTTSSMSSKSSHLPGTPKRHDQFSQQQHDTTITHASVNAAGASPNPKSTGNEDSNGGNNDAGNTSSDDYSDEIKVYNEEGAAEEEQRNSDDLKEEKTEIIQKTIEEKPSPSHPFSINNLFGFGAAAAAASKSNASSSPFGNNPFAAAAAFGALNQQRNSLFNPAALYSQELASHFASWWPAAAAAGANAFNPYSSPAFNPFNPFSAAANYQQQAAAAAVFQAAAASRFSPSLFLPPPPGTNGLASPKAEPSSHSASSSASSTSSNGSSSSSSSSAFSSASNSANPNMHPSSPFSSSSGSSSNSSRFNNQHHNPSQQHMSSPSTNSFNHKSHLSSSTKKKNHNYENNYPIGNGHMGNIKHHPDGQQGHMGNHIGHHNHHQGNPLHPNHYIKQESQNHYIKQEGHLAAPVPHVMVKEKPKKPHVKKPLNAFMLFMKEQRAAVVSECTLRESAAINQILGRKWHELERTEQAKYYEKARLARLEHMQQNPGWSARDNYGLKKKRRRKREKVIGENGELPRKCRARYGLHQLHLWCKPCRRKKKCIRFAGNGEDTQNSQMMGPGGQFHMGDGSGSMNGSGGNSDDDYENYEDDSDETETDTDDENDESGYQQSPKPNKQPHLMNSHSGTGHLPGPPGFHLPPNHPGNLMQNPYQQHQPGQQYQQMHNSFNSHLLKQMSNQMGRADMDAKAMLQHQLKLNQEPF